MLYIAAQLSDSDEDSEDFFIAAQSAEDKVPEGIRVAVGALDL